MKKHIIALTCLIFFYSGCSVNQDENNVDISPGVIPESSQIVDTDDENDKSSIEEITENDTSNTYTIEQVDLSSYFEGINGCAVIFDNNKSRYIMYNNNLYDKRSSPCSTFKIISTIIGLKADVLESEDTKLTWNGNMYPVNAWNQNLTLKQAFQSSCVWYFRQVLDNSGENVVQNTLSELSYGNCDISQWEGSNTNAGYAELNGFWLESSLLISPREQVDTLMKIFANEDKSFISILKNIMSVDDAECDFKIYGKTGTGYKDNLCVDAWFVGLAEKEDRTYYFAIRLDDPNNSIVSGQKAKEIALSILCEFEEMSFYTNDESYQNSEIYTAVEQAPFQEDTSPYPELEALNLVKTYIAGSNDSIFEPISSTDTPTYKFRNSNYMIQYDSKIDNQHHLIHQYEVVIDDPVTGEGHTATSNWYEVDIHTGEIIPMFNEDGSLNENY